MTSRRWMVGSIASVALLLIAGRALSGWYVDYQWYASLGAAEVWRARAVNLSLLRASGFLIASLFVFVNLYAVRYSVVSLVLPRRVGNLEIGEEVSGHLLLAATAVLSLLIGVLLALPHSDWMSLELIRHGAAFGETDPYFALDLGFWLYWLPLEQAVHGWAIVALIAILLVVVLLYALTPSLRWEGGRLHVTTYVRRHLLLLGAALLLLLGWSYRIDAFLLLHNGSGPMQSFSAIDHRVGIPTNLVLAVVSVAAAMLVAWTGWTGQLRVAFATITLMLLMALSARQIVPPIAERFVAPAEPEARERPYRDIRNGYSRRAYDVDRLTRVRPGAGRLAFADAVRGAAMWDGAALARAIGGARGSAVQSGDLGWEERDGRLIAFTVQRPRGPESAEVRPAWGISAVAADMTDDRGNTIARDDPDAPDAGTVRTLLVHDDAPAFYVLSDSAAQVPGPDLRGFWSRLAHSWALQYGGLLSRDASTGSVRLLLRPRLRERLRALYPFFEQGSRVAPVAWRDSIFWAVDLYSASDWYPLSQPFRFGSGDVRFLRRAGVALVNAHTGVVRTVAEEQPDSLTMSWIRRFPSLFVSEGVLDADLVRRIPPPIDAALVTLQAFAQVGVRGEFLGRARVPPPLLADTLFTLATTAPYFDRRAGLLALAFPLIEAGDRIRGVVSVPGGAQFQPHWEAFEPAGPLWPYVSERLAAPRDSVMRAALRGTRPTHGAVRVLPTDEGLLAVQAHYATRPEGTPQVLYVSLFSRDSVRVGSTLVGAAGLALPSVSEEPMTPEAFRARVASLNDAMRDALRRGDWSAFGIAFDALGRLLRPVR